MTVCTAKYVDRKTAYGLLEVQTLHINHIYQTLHQFQYNIDALHVVIKIEEIPQDLKTPEIKITIGIMSCCFF